ncbi:MAG TPA: anti-sigma factor [Geminicoccaceae bacterium]|nr:anti-sigma factor [Geminicoccaceae bacterium]
MMTATPTEERHELQVLAGEYALGLLDPRETAAFERAMAEDPGLAGMVGRWEGGLGELAETVDPVAPDPAVWRRVAITVAQLEGAGPLKQQRGGRRRRWGRWWSSPVFWRLSTAAAVAAALALAAYLFVVPTPEPRAPDYIAVLQAEGGEPGWVIQEAADGSLLVTPLRRVEVPEGRALQLWTRLDPAAGMVSLGLVPADASVRLPPAALPFLADGQFFGITLEPATGAPAAGPRGSVLYAGHAVQTPRGGGAPGERR